MTNTQNWKEIWNSKKLANISLGCNEFETFCILKKLDGFDVNVGDEKAYFEGFYKDWLKMHNLIKSLVLDFDSVFEVGCGGGVNLYMFKRHCPEVKIGGIDYSKSLIDNARNILPDGEFDCAEANEIIDKEKYDVVISDSVFQYFPSEEYAEEVLHKMCEKASKLVFLGDLHDKGFKNEWLDNRRKAIENYDERYKGLNRTFVTREWVDEIAVYHGRRVIFENKNNEQYWSSKYVFDAYIY